MELLGKEIHSEITVLTRLSGSGDANDLTWSALEDQEIANTDVVAGDGDGVWRHPTLDNANILTDTVPDTGRSTLLIHNDFLTLGVMVMRMERVEDPISGFLNAVAEGVIVAFVVVVAHVGSVPWDFGGGLGLDFEFFSGNGSGSTIDFYVVGWVDASTIFALGNVDVSFSTAGKLDVNLGV